MSTSTDICAHCGTKLENIKLFDYTETQTVPVMKYYEDDAELVYEDRSWTEHSATGYCPKCKKTRTWDAYCTCFI